MRKLLFQSPIQSPLTELLPPASAVAALDAALAGSARRRLGRSLAIRMIDAGSCNGCKLEISVLGNAFCDLDPFGLYSVPSPRHADVLLISSPVTCNMREALQRTYHATLDPKWVVAVGECARNDGCFDGSNAVVGGVAEVVRVDLYIPGCPPDPTALLTGLLALMQAQRTFTNRAGI